MDTAKIGKFLQELRIENKLTQEGLAEKIGCTNKTISRWETGVYMPPIEMLLVLSELYKVSITEILHGERIKADKLILISYSFGGTLTSNYMAKYNDNVYQSIFISPGNIYSGDKTITKRTNDGNKDNNQALTKNIRYFACQILTSISPSTGLYYLMDEDKLDNIFIQFYDTLNMKPGSGEYYNTLGAGFGFWNNMMAAKSCSKAEKVKEKHCKMFSDKKRIRLSFI